jgi:acetyl esterase/lipase
MTRKLLRSWYGRVALAVVVCLAVIALVGVRESSDDPPTERRTIGAPVARDPVGVARGTMLLVHGGSWRGSDPREQTRLLREPGEVFLARSWRVVSVDYRSGRAGLRDILAAIGRQPDRTRHPLCLYGESAGAHLALLAAARRPSVDCVIGAAPPTDFQAYFADAAAGSDSVHRAVAALIRRTFGATPDQTASWEPVKVADCIQAEVLLVRAAGDPLIPPAQVERFVAARPGTASVELAAGDPAKGAQQWVHGPISTRARRLLHSRLAAFADRAASARARAANARLSRSEADSH